VTPTPSTEATPEATPEEPQIILGYMAIPALGSMEVDLRGWSPGPPPDPVADGLFDAGYCEGPSCGLHEIYRHDPTRSATSFVHYDRERSSLDRAVRFELVDLVTDEAGLMAAIRRIASESGDPQASISGPIDLPAGLAGQVQWTRDSQFYPPIAVTQYLILAEDRTVLATFAVPFSERVNQGNLAAEDAVIKSLRVTGSNLRLGTETYEPIVLDLTGWSLPPEWIGLAILAAERGGLPGAWQLVTTTRTDTVMLRHGLIALYPSGAYQDPVGIILVRALPPSTGELDARAQSEADAARGGNGRVVRAIQLPAGPASVIRSSFETNTHAVIEVIEYVIDTEQGFVVVEFAARQSEFADVRAEFQRVVESVGLSAP
jgi:hypothetical protein